MKLVRRKREYCLFNFIIKIYLVNYSIYWIQDGEGEREGNVREWGKGRGMSGSGGKGGECQEVGIISRTLPTQFLLR